MRISAKSWRWSRENPQMFYRRQSHLVGSRTTKTLCSIVQDEISLLHASDPHMMDHTTEIERWDALLFVSPIRFHFQEVAEEGTARVTAGIAFQAHLISADLCQLPRFGDLVLRHLRYLSDSNIW
jgi:hypothetical protein